ncbi:hypothetical protein ACFQHO_07030 [Actinomadura yumaensis]|uniref:Uncharacterized protein n=2 Tax=Actinomadura yumaensis TaxID=111807 RepID=A0ABW2CQE2_9ACTN
MRERWIGPGLIGGAMALVPWTVVLAVRLPSTAQVSHWSAAWVGLDLMLAAGLLGTGVLFRRGDARYGLTAAATGALLLMDAWFDVMTATSGGERALASALALGLELPLAAFCTALALNAHRPASAAGDGVPADAGNTPATPVSPTVSASDPAAAEGTYRRR